MKKIIVPIDFSEHSEYAIKTAAQLAKHINGEILLLHMLEIPELMLTSNDNDQHQRILFFFKIAEKKIKEFMKKDYLKDVPVKPIVKNYKVFSEVNDVAKEHHADIIVMGSHGASGLKEFFIGSNTERVVRNSEIPVLVVKNDLPDLNFEKVVFATNFDLENVEPYLKASNFFNDLEVEMKMIYINLPNENFKSTPEIKDRIITFLNTADGNLNRLVDVEHRAHYTVEEGVVGYAHEIGAKLIAIPTHGRKGVTHFFAGSIGEDIANHAALPVMTFKI